VIARNVIQNYIQSRLPSIEEIEQEATRLISIGYKTKKGKLLTRLNRHSKKRFSNPEQRSFVEDDIELFKRLTINGYIIPTTSENAGGRVVSSFTLMPSWIRNLVTIDGERLQEVDFVCLHPNIAMNIYSGLSEYITHQKVAKNANMDVLDVKKEHLSFFNKPWENICNSPLYSYYCKAEPGMMERIYLDKKENGYINTFRQMVTKEVEIMTEIIARLNKRDIFVGYIYDALTCLPGQIDIVRDEMNKVILEFGVKTIAK
jgi:hypothetical protein